MKNNYFKKTLLTIFSIVLFSSLLAQPEHVYIIGGPVNKNNPNWLLDQKIELTKDELNPSIFYFKGYLAYNWRGDERGNIKFLVSNSWENAFHPDNDENILLTGTTSMSQDSRDTKWFIPENRSGDGYYELTLDTELMILTVDLFRHDPYPGEIYMVGSSVPSGWDNNNPEVMVRTEPEVAIYTWTGLMGSGDFKFLHPLSIGNWDFAYAATSPNEDVNFGTAQDIVFEVRDSEETSFNDHKFIMNETVECTVTVDLVNNTMTVTKDGELAALDLWITGSAIPGGKAKLVSDNVDPLISYHYYGELLLGEFKFATTEVPDATTQYYVPTSSSDAIATNIDVSLSSDETVSGWIVSQADDLYKIKLNTLSKKYTGSVFGIDHVYIVGGATAAGWDAGNAIELTKGEGALSHIFTFQGKLMINSDVADGNKFKFLLQKDWNPFSYHPEFEDEVITDAQFFTEKTSTDYKWIIAEDKQGDYTIKLNVLEETIEEVTFVPGTSTELVEKEAKAEVLLVDRKLIVNSDEVLKSIEIFNLNGYKVATKLVAQNAEFILPKGFYIVKIIYNNSSAFIKKVNIH